MVSITLPDGSQRQFDGSVTGTDLARDISKSLAKAAVAVRVDGELKDIYVPIERDSEVEIITRDSEAGVDLLRHDAAHVLAEAVKELYPETQVTIGPTIENGFYYDFSRAEPFTPEDLETIESRMREIVARNEEIRREVWDRDEAVAYFQSIGEVYKAEIIAGIPEGEEVGLYRQGEFVDLCRGPHLESTGRLGSAFKLMSVAGAYWRGDSRNEMLQRIYGTAWASDKDLNAYLVRLEEAEKRDHRRLGREMDLFHLQEEGPGAVFWHPKGWTMFQRMIDYMRRKQIEAGYDEVNTPEILDRSLWERSGHLEKFGENMYLTQTPDERVYAVKPMNCPGHVQIFKQGIKSYRDLPLYLAEFGKVHRYEPSGALHGLMRVRAFVQDDAHIFCTEEQITEECVKASNLIIEIYRDFGFEDVRVKYADRPERRVGSDEVWDNAEAALKTALEASGLEWTLNPGEGAFYGPKLEFVLRDAIGRDWQCGTVQVDLNLPERLGATYVAADGSRQYPVMIHRAMFGSLERFFGILIEHHAGHLPLWLAPVQAVVATITDDADDYAHAVVAAARAAGLRVEADLRNEKISYKVREHSVAKVPVMLVVGKREAEEGTVAIRRLGGKAQDVLALDAAIAALGEEARSPLDIH
ncbi:MAG: threonine--tRNA ligase [Pseudomonadales bacterium]|nr:threonine--tRNA ligase [Pseudomonadales bacterium]NIX06832.1 threonine--tRNA ligase [Pseudomonadales bacterium]